jgi:glycosyltransferase involved in cell wall biosynthesis
MKILYICDKLITFILNEAIELKAKNHDILILSEHDQRNYDVINKPILTENGLAGNYYRFSSFKNRKQKYFYFIKNLIYDFFVYPTYAVRGVIYILKNYPGPKYGVVDYLDVRALFGSGIDIIHSPFSTPRVIDKVYLLSNILNVPFTLCFRAHDIYDGDNFSEALKRFDMIKKASQIITIADYNKKHIQSKIDIEDIEVIHSALNIDYFKPEDGKRSHRSIVTVCRLSEEKGIIYLIEACHILNKRKIDYECIIIGEGRERENYERLIRMWEVPNIKFTGYLQYDEIKEYLNLSTVFVLPSIASASGLEDVLSNALKEAMAMQVPVITTKVHAIEELVDDGINGILVPQHDPEAIADAIAKILNNPDLGNQMGEEGRKKIEKGFNIKIETGKLEEIFKETTHKRRGAWVCRNILCF